MTGAVAAAPPRPPGWSQVKAVMGRDLDCEDEWEEQRTNTNGHYDSTNDHYKGTNDRYKGTAAPYPPRLLR